MVHHRSPRPARRARASTVQFSPTAVPTYDDLLDRVVKIVGVSDDHALVARCADAVLERFAARVSASQSQPYYLDVTHPDANKGVVVQRLSQHYAIRPTRSPPSETATTMS